MTAHLRVCDGERVGVTCGVAQVHAYQWHIVGVVRLDVGEMAVVVKQWARFSVGEETALESGKVGALLRRWLRRRLRRRLWLRWRGGFRKKATWGWQPRVFGIFATTRKGFFLEIRGALFIRQALCLRHSKNSRETGYSVDRPRTRWTPPTSAALRNRGPHTQQGPPTRFRRI